MLADVYNFFSVRWLLCSFLLTRYYLFSSGVCRWDVLSCFQAEFFSALLFAARRVLFLFCIPVPLAPRPVALAGLTCLGYVFPIYSVCVVRSGL